jgi:glutathione S-transferase
MAEPLLWHFPISHFNEKVRWALDWKGIPHRRKALGADYLPRALWATGQGSLPILFLDGSAIADSTRIIAALEAAHPEPALYPRDDAARRRALALEDYFDEELGPALRTVLVGEMFATDPDAALRTLATGMAPGMLRIMRAGLPAFRAFYRARHRINAETIATGRRQMAAALDRLEAEIGPSGHLVGDAFTVADLTAAALFAPVVVPPELQYPPPSPPPATFVALRASMADRPGFRWVLDTYHRHRGRSAEVAA